MNAFSKCDFIQHARLKACTTPNSLKNVKNCELWDSEPLSQGNGTTYTQYFLHVTRNWWKRKINLPNIAYPQSKSRGSSSGLKELWNCFKISPRLQKSICLALIVFFTNTSRNRGVGCVSTHPPRWHYPLTAFSLL